MRGPLYTFLVLLVSNIIYLKILSQLVKECRAYRSTKHYITLCGNPSGQVFSHGSLIIFSEHQYLQRETLSLHWLQRPVPLTATIIFDTYDFNKISDNRSSK